MVRVNVGEVEFHLPALQTKTVTTGIIRYYLLSAAAAVATRQWLMQVFPADYRRSRDGVCRAALRVGYLSFVCHVFSQSPPSPHSLNL